LPLETHTDRASRLSSEASSAASEQTAFWIAGASVVFKTFCAVIVVISTALTVVRWGPNVETFLWPVTEKLRILSIGADNRNRSILMVEFRKLRDCEYLGIAWFRGSRTGGFIRVPIELRREQDDASSPNRPVGVQQSGPWVVAVPPHEIEDNSFAVLYHRCNPFWVTTTDFYP
jgi:hypothetical protein